MATLAKHPQGSSIIEEMKEFAGFPKATQRYIRRSLDIGLGRNETVRRWARDASEAAGMRIQLLVYGRLQQLRELVAEPQELLPAEPLMAPLIALTAYDLAQGRINGFTAYRFLYERLIGPGVRPWLPAAFCAAATLPSLHPELRRNLLRTMDEATAMAPGWSLREPGFMPEWVEKVEVEVA